MNYFAHACPFLDRPYFAAATGVPDWLTVADRRVRLRAKHVEPLLDDADPCLAAIAGGILQHIRDDAQFHGSRAFAESWLELAARTRRLLGKDEGFRPGFLGHLLVELLLDAALMCEGDSSIFPAGKSGQSPSYSSCQGDSPIFPAGKSGQSPSYSSAAPKRLAEYYRVLESIDPERIEWAVNRMAPRRTERLALMISEFGRRRILSDYLEDGKLLERVNQVLRRVGLERLPDGFVELLPGARRLVADRRAELLRGIPTVLAPAGAGNIGGKNQCVTE